MVHRQTVRFLTFSMAGLFLAFSSFARPVMGQPAGAQGARYTGEPRTIAHDILDLEKEFGAGPEHYAVVERIINRAMAQVPVKRESTMDDAIITLSAIDALLRREGFAFRDNVLFVKGLDAKRIDCDNYCALYIAIAEVMRIPLVPVYAPDHCFLRYYFPDGSFVNWDPSVGKSLTDAFYTKEKLISRQSIQKGVYLKTLTRREFIAIEYNAIGSHLLTVKKFNEANTYFSAAIAAYPAFSSAYHNRGISRIVLKKIPEARADLETAKELDPLRASTRIALGDVYMEIRDYQTALQHYAASIKLEPNNYIPYHNTAVILQKLGRESEAQAWLKKARQVQSKNAR